MANLPRAALLSICGGVLLVALGFAAAARAAEGPTVKVRGHVLRSREQPGIFIIREDEESPAGRKHGPSTDYLVESSRLDPETRRLLEAEVTKSLTDSGYFVYPGEAFEIPVGAYRARAAMGLHADCSERPLDYRELVETATRAGSTVDFLKALPPETLQTFTLVHDGQSFQRDTRIREKERPYWPRVIRASNDGKLIIAYTCYPKSPKYNTVEVTRFDDAKNEFVYSEIDYRRKAKRRSLGTFFSRRRPPAPWHPQLTEKPATCLGCHSAKVAGPMVDPRPNWLMYPKWLGVYGSDDDILDLGESETSMFLKFRERQANNPCYSTLPWPKDPSPNYRHYPYTMVGSKGGDYLLRPNLKLTEILSRLNAKRIARRFYDDRRYRQIRYLIAMEAVGGCRQELDRQLASGLPGYTSPISVTSDRVDAFGFYSAELDPANLESGALRLFQVGKIFGLEGMDWTLTPPANNPVNRTSPFYRAAIPVETKKFNYADGSISRAVQSELFRRLTLEEPELAQFYKVHPGTEHFFGKKFACLEDKVGGLMEPLSEPEQQKLCDWLVKKQAGLEKASAFEPCPPPSGVDATGIIDSVAPALNALPK